jgi:lipoate-protein ligase A
MVVGSYCPGNFDLAVGGKKIAGISQHWFRNRRGVRCAMTSASINIDEAAEELEHVVNQFYRGADSPLRCSATALTSVGSRTGPIAAQQRDLASAVINQIGLVAMQPPITTGRLGR